MYEEGSEEDREIERRKNRFQQSVLNELRG